MSTKPDKKKGGALTVIEGGRGDVITGDAARMTKDQVELMRRTLCPDLNEDEAALYVHYCQSSGADPLKKEAWAQVRFAKKKDSYGSDVIRDGKQVYERRLVMGLSKNQVQKRLEERPDFAGLQSAVVYEKDEFTADLGSGAVKHVVKTLVKKDRGMMIAAWAKISRNGKEPYIRILDVSERRDDKNFNWGKMPETMLLKCVEMDAVRSCYPKEFGSVYSEEEAGTFGEKLDPGQFVEAHAAPAGDTTKEIETFAQELPAVAAAPQFDTEAGSQGGAFVDDNQMRGMKALLQEFSLSNADFSAIVEKVTGRKAKSLADIRKPDYQKIAKAFDCVRNAEYALRGGKLYLPGEAPAPAAAATVEEPYNDDDVPFGKQMPKK